MHGKDRPPSGAGNGYQLRRGRHRAPARWGARGRELVFHVLFIVPVRAEFKARPQVVEVRFRIQ